MIAGALVALALLSGDGENSNRPRAVSVTTSFAAIPAAEESIQEGSSNVSVASGTAAAGDTAPDEVLSGRVVDANTASIRDALVLWFDHGDVGASVRSDDAGRFALAVARSSTARVIAMCTGYATATLRDPRITSDVPAELVIELDAEGRIAGHVRLPDGGAPSIRDDVRVLVRRDHLTPSESIRLSEGAAVPVGLQAVDATGRFEVVGLRAGEICRLTAWGNGLSASQWITAQAGGRHVELVVSPVYCIDVRLSDADGGPLRCGSRVFSDWPVLRVERAPDGLQETVGDLPAITEQGYNPQMDGTSTDHRSLRLFTSTENVARLGPLVVTAAAPGYERGRAEVWAYRARREPHVVQTVHLRRMTDQFGTIRIHVRGGPPDAMSGGEGQVQTWSRLLAVLLRGDGTHIAGGYRWLRVDVPVPIRSPIEVTGVPTGRYRARIMDMIVPPPAEEGKSLVVVEANAVAELTLDTGDWSVVDVSLVRPDGGLYGGPATIDVGAEGGERMYGFARDPYCVFGVPPGVVRIRALSDTWVSPWEQVDVGSRRRHSVVLTLQERQ